MEGGLDEEARIVELVALRATSRAHRDYATADAARDELLFEYRVTVDDEKPLEWKQWGEAPVPKGSCVAWVRRRQAVAGVRQGAHCEKAVRGGHQQYYCAAHAETPLCKGRVPCPR